MSFYFNPQEANEGLHQQASAGPETGFLENTLAAFEATKLTDLTVSEVTNYSRAYDDIIEALNEGAAFNKRFSNPYKAGAQVTNFGDRRGVGLPSDPALLAKINAPKRSREDQLTAIWAEIDNRRQADPAAFSSLPGSRAELEAQVRADVRKRVEDLEEINSRSSGRGSVGQFVGTAGALITQEPLTVLSLPFGAPRSAGVLRTALLEAQIAGGIEAIIQPAVQAYRAELGLEAGADIAFENILAAMGGGALFGGGFKAIAKALGKNGKAFEAVADMDEKAVAEAFDRLVPDPTPAQRAARNAVQLELDLIDTNPYAADKLATHKQTLDAATDDLSTRSEAGASDSGVVPEPLEARYDALEADLFGPAADPRLLEKQIRFDDVDDTGQSITRTSTFAEVKTRLDADRALLAEVEACA